MSFSVDYDKQPIKFLKNQDKHVAKRILDKIDEVLPENPVPHNAVSIAGEHGVFRIRVGEWRVLYRINYQEKKIVIVRLEKRPRAYG